MNGMKIKKAKRKAKAQAAEREHTVTTRLGPARRTTVFITEDQDAKLDALNRKATKVLGTNEKRHYSLAQSLREGSLLFFKQQDKFLDETKKGEHHAKKRK